MRDKTITTLSYMRIFMRQEIKKREGADLELDLDTIYKQIDKATNEEELKVIYKKLVLIMKEIIEDKDLDKVSVPEFFKPVKR